MWIVFSIMYGERVTCKQSAPGLVRSGLLRETMTMRQRLVFPTEARCDEVLLQEVKEGFYSHSCVSFLIQKSLCCSLLYECSVYRPQHNKTTQLDYFSSLSCISTTVNSCLNGGVAAEPGKLSRRPPSSCCSCGRSWLGVSNGCTSCS